jgi:hypothetical protein
MAFTKTDINNLFLTYHDLSMTCRLPDHIYYSIGIIRRILNMIVDDLNIQCWRYIVVCLFDGV